jgi:tRNA(Arg) A34 adenosine deaminase TadA
MDVHDRGAKSGKGRLGEKVDFPEIRIEHPGWVRRKVDWTRLYHGDRDRMRVALLVARENVLQKSGGPFGAAVFESATGRLVAVGSNRVVPLGNSLLHAETVALAMAEQRLGSHRLDADGLPALELHTSCEPCAMCLGALFAAGVPRLVCAAAREDAEDLGFDEGPVFPASWDYVKARGMEVVRAVLRDEAREVLQLYRGMGGPLYG